MMDAVGYLSDLIAMFEGAEAGDDASAANAASFTARVARIREGDAAAFDELVLAFSLQLESYARRLMGTTEAAQDVVQDVFAHLWEHRATLHIRGSVRGYLYAAIRHRALDLGKQSRSETARWSVTNADGVPVGMAEARYESDAAMYQQEIRLRVEAALNALPPRARETALLRWRDGLSRGEIAAIMGVSVPTVNNQLTHAANAMRVLLADLRDEV